MVKRTAQLLLVHGIVRNVGGALEEFLGLDRRRSCRSFQCELLANC